MIQKNNLYSGLSEIAGIYDHLNGNLLDSFNKTELDTVGFNIPDKIIKEFKIKMKKFSIKSKPVYRLPASGYIVVVDCNKTKTKHGGYLTGVYNFYLPDNLVKSKKFIEITGEGKFKIKDKFLEFFNHLGYGPLTVSTMIPVTYIDLSNLGEGLYDASEMVDSNNKTFSNEADGTKLYSSSEVKTKDGLTPKQVVSANKSQCDKLVKRFYKEYKTNNEGFVLKELGACYNECKDDFVRIDSKDARWKDLLLELASRMVAIEMVDKNATHFHPSNKQFDAIPKDHLDQELGNNSFIVVKVSPTTGEYFYYDIISEFHPWWDIVYKTHVDQDVSKLVDGKFVLTPQTKPMSLSKANEYLQNKVKKLGVRSYSRNFSNGADALVSIDYFNQIHDALKSIYNISKLSSEFKNKLTKSDCTKILKSLADKINYEYNDKTFSNKDKDWYVVGILVTENGDEEVYSAVQPHEEKPTKEEVLAFEPKAKDLKYFKVFANEESADAYRDGLAIKIDKNKMYSDMTVNSDPSILNQEKSNSTHSINKSDGMGMNWSVQSPFNLSIEPWLVANIINGKSDGLYIGSLLGDSIDLGSDHLSLDIKLGNSQPTDVFVIVREGKAIIFKASQLSKKNKSFSAGNYDYRFSIVPTEVSYEMQYLIGSWMMASSICHLYHICDNKYAGHVALDEFYKEFPEKIDALAEHFLADNDKAEFRVCVIPGQCPIDYLTRLLQFTLKYVELTEGKIPSSYQSQLDEIVCFTQSILYKLKRLDSGRRIFSIKK